MSLTTSDGVTQLPENQAQFAEQLAGLTRRHNVAVWHIGSVLEEAYAALAGGEYHGLLHHVGIGERNARHYRRIHRELTADECENLSLRACLSLLSEPDETDTVTVAAHERITQLDTDSAAGIISDCQCTPGCNCLACCKCCPGCSHKHDVMSL